ncbi:hypothetical protein IJG78_02455, partial [Candidatus Saccharibacteria bacterium]|nr:hypothetical protein [Candidatus Saccharibacteria bacterium]
MGDNIKLSNNHGTKLGRIHHLIHKSSFSSFSSSSTSSRMLSHRNITLTFSIFFVAFVVTFLSFSIFAPVNSSDAATVTTNLSAGGYYINITSNDVVLDVTTTVSGTTS